ncbi:hypothetical protein HUT03_05085 [Candidatus Liberibacter africanus]|uniref:Uncharacterized protein n=1 Tax=Candidatus Liberibacter africanus PTSAPSY TaxID=1277257 RepID=A0A0G3I403_LIBAF|nr:hypothetical protein [Candidatus Liberibacter africanus]AKK20614.1 hypothetical protein G293_04995 [Candidatus Liberibacter africanus PTSAPSY]QTP64296.1 hypothetical protein HUT03_05085 [Candidatus Liberibacter africanus]
MVLQVTEKNNLSEITSKNLKGEKIARLYQDGHMAMTGNPANGGWMTLTDTGYVFLEWQLVR